MIKRLVMIKLWPDLCYPLHCEVQRLLDGGSCSDLSVIKLDQDFI